MMRKFPITKLDERLRKNIIRYFENNYNEQCLFASFDDKNEFKEYKLINGSQKDNINIPLMDVKNIVDSFVFKDIVVIHNHPRGSYEFSKSDKESFIIWKNMEKTLECNFLDLLIVTPRVDFYTRLSDPLLNLEINPLIIEIKELKNEARIKKVNVKILSPNLKEVILTHDIVVDTDIMSVKNYIIGEYSEALNAEIYFLKGDKKERWL